MKRFLIISTLIAVPLVVPAQTQDDDGEGYLAGLIEDNLSGVSREVDIQGFAGALSSEATIDRLTIADAEGIWLTLEGIVLEWNRSALLRGAIDVEELSAERIIVARPPLSEDTGPAPEAQPFSLPELPVSIALDQLDIDLIELGPAFLGEDIALSLTGSAQLSDGEGVANIIARRLGDKTGIFEFDGSYENETRVLDVLLNVQEGADGIAARLLELPGRPAIGLEVAGSAPIDDYAATIAVATDGQDRLRGDFTLASGAEGRQIGLDINGDVSPLFEPAYQSFFGTDASLQAEVIQSNDGRIEVPLLELDAGRIALNGSLELGQQGWPERFDLNGGITPLGNEPVLLPLSGPETYVDEMDVIVRYDAAVSDDWVADIAVAGFERPGLSIATLAFEGGGIIRAGEGLQIGAFTADLGYGATGLRLDDAGASEAFGNEIGGRLLVERTEGDVTEVSQLTLSGAGLDVRAQATIAGPESGFQTDATINAEVAGLARFAQLVGQDLAGGAALEVVADVTPLEGLFDLVLTAQTRDLAVGIPEADRVLAGDGDITARAVRDSEGTRLESLTIQTDAADLRASADLTSDGADAQISANLRDVSLVVDGLSGPAAVSGTVNRAAEGDITFALDGTGPAASFRTNGTVTAAEAGQVIAAELTANMRDLSRYATLAGRPLAGAVTLRSDGELQTDGLLFSATIEADTRDLVTGIDRADPLLDGVGRIEGTFTRGGAERFEVVDLLVETPALSLRGDADLEIGKSNTADLTFRLNDIAVLEPSLSGPVTVRLDAVPAPDDGTQASLRAQGPGIDVTLDALVASAAQEYALSGEVAAQVEDLGAYAPLIGQPVAGSVDLNASGDVLSDLSAFETQVNLRTEDLRTGIPTLDALLTGTGRINATIALDDGVLGVRTLEVSTQEVSIVGALNGAAGFGQGRFNASLRDVGVLTDQISGPIRATGGASLDEDGNWGVDANATGPGGLGAQIVGQVAQNGNLAIDINGSAPLALANTAIDPRRLSGLANFDLAVNGPPALGSLSGQITFSDGRLAAPNLGQALSGITGQIGLGDGTAQIDLRTQVEAGGSIAINGPVAMTGNNQANITVTANEIILQDPQLYSTEMSGAINVNGPLQGGARIAGTLNLGETNVRVPSSSISSLGDLPDVEHVNASASVRQTLRRAGVIGEDSDATSSGGGPSFPLDIVINAPSRIFIRGRGLDAELGGSLAIGGTSANVQPVGRFSLVRGRIDILQQRFELTEGVATLQGDFEPFIRLVATTETETGTVISIVVEGPAGEPEVSFVSVPELPQDEVLSQLIFGRDIADISPFQAVQLASAISTLAGRGGGTVDRLRQTIGLDDFDVTTDDEGNAAVRAGAYLSENVYTDVTVTSQGDTEINLNLDLTDQITAKGSVDQDGEGSVGLFYERDY